MSRYWFLPFMLGCLHTEKTGNTEAAFGTQTFLTSNLREGITAKEPELRYQAWEGLFVLQDPSTKEASFEKILQDSDRFVREEASRFVWKQGELALLQKGLAAVTLQDGEKCLLALDIYSLSQEKSLGAWPIISEGDLEDQFFCALAASTILEIKTPWQELIEAGDYPLSLLVVDSLVNFASVDEVSLFAEELEWAEEGIRASLWAGWILIDPSRIALLRKQMAGFSDEECLEMVDLAWRHRDAAGAEKLLQYLQRQSGFCGTLADIALISGGEKGLLGVEKRLEKGEREEVVALLLALQDYPYRSSKKKRQLRSQIEKLAVYDQEPLILMAAVRVLGTIGDRGSQKKMKALLEKNIDRPILIEIEKSYNQIEKRKGKL